MSAPGGVTVITNARVLTGLLVSRPTPAITRLPSELAPTL